MSAAKLFADLNPAGLSPTNFLRFGNDVLFAGNDPHVDPQVYISDGTRAGTKQISSIDSDPDSLLPMPLYAAGKVAYFAATEETGAALYRTDGTSAGTKKLLDVLDSGTASQGFGSFAQVGGNVFFVYELKTNGGTEATLYKDGPGGLSVVRQSGNGFGIPRQLIAVGSMLYMAVDTPAGPQLWQSDGTSGGTKAITFHANILTQFAEFNNELYFAAQTTAKAGGDQGLWKLKHGTKPVFLKATHDLIVLNQASNSGALWLDIWDSDSDPRQLWRLNNSGLEQMTDFAAGGGQTRDDYIQTSSSGIYFIASGSQLWFCSPSDPSATLLTTFPDPSPKGGAQSVIFMDSDGTSVFAEVQDKSKAVVWKYNISSKQAQALGNVALKSPMSLADHIAVFASPDSTGYEELWSTKSSGVGTQELTDIMGGPADSEVGDLAAFKDGLLFTTATSPDDPESLFNFWFTDGSSAPTEILSTSLQPLYPASRPESAVYAGDKFALVSFFNYDKVGTEKGYDIWRTDGTTTGTFDLQTNTFPTHFIGELNGKILYSSEEEALGSTDIEHIWSTDGTVAGTKLLTSINLSSLSGMSTIADVPGEVLNGRIYFGVHGKLYRSDGTSGGTMLAPEFPQDGSVDVEAMALRSGKLLIAGFSDLGGLTNDDPPTVWSLSARASHVTKLVEGIPTQAYPDPMQLLVFPGASQTFLVVDQYTFNIPLNATSSPDPITFNVSGDDTHVIGYAGGNYYVQSYSETEDGYAIYALDSSMKNPKRVTPFGVYTDTKQAITVGSSLVYFDLASNKMYSINGTTQTLLTENDESPGGLDFDQLDSELTLVGNKLFFINDQDGYGAELWRDA